MSQLFTILFLIIYTIGCGVKGAPLPRQDSAYIFNQNQNQNHESESDVKSETDTQMDDSEEKKESVKDDQ